MTLHILGIDIAKNTWPFKVPYRIAAILVGESGLQFIF